MIRSWLWFVIDTGWFLMTAAATVLVCVSLIATPVWLGLIRHDVQAIREQAAQVQPCHCRHRDEDGPGPVLPRVLPRVRRIGEEAAE